MPGLNSLPVDLQSDSHLLPDKLPTALRGPVFKYLMLMWLFKCIQYLYHLQIKRFEVALNGELSVTTNINCIVARCLSHGMCLYQVMMTLHFLNDVANDAESTQKIENYVIIGSLKRETIGNLITRIPGSRLLMSSLSGSALRTHVESLGKPRHVNKRSQSRAW